MSIISNFILAFFFDISPQYYFEYLFDCFVIFFMRWMKSGDFLKEIMAFYFAVHLIFLLRGDLANGLTYYVGPLIASYFIPKIIESLLTKRKR